MGCAVMSILERATTTQKLLAFTKTSQSLHAILNSPPMRRVFSITSLGSAEATIINIYLLLRII
jgi:hypothetical protein